MGMEYTIAQMAKDTLKKIDEMKKSPVVKDTADRFLELIEKERNLYLAKNHDYANSGPKHGNFERVAAILKLYEGFPSNTPAGVCVTYALKQLDAVLWGMTKCTSFQVEGFEERLRDISIYLGKILVMILEECALKTDPPHSVKWIPPGATV